MRKKLEEDKKKRFGDSYKPIKPKIETPTEKFNNVYDKMYKIYRMG